MLYAHTQEGAPQSEWQLLSDHLAAVERLAARSSAAFGAGEWGRIIGRLHDIGKCNPKFQMRLTGESRKHADHKGLGASLLDGLGTGFGRIGAYCVAGHHGGLPDYSHSKNKRSLRQVIAEAITLPDDVENPLAAFVEPGLPFVPEDGFACSFFTRMLFSVLVDADFLDTERFMTPGKHAWRVPGPSMYELATALDKRLAAFDSLGRINGLRAEILAHCRNKAPLVPGLFTLSVPTGGGKTLSSMAFALDHARHHGLRRVIYVIPYTSIIEQNARVFRDVFRDHPGAVIEHHSTFDPRHAFSEADNAGETDEARRHRLACENWDAPVVVTTSVQFFESFFAAKPSRCRKLHNVAGSVIILDEAQMLPVEYLDPCLRALEELTDHYGCSVVLCTATQPALRREDFAANRRAGRTPGLTGLNAERELAPEPDRLHEAFRRTELRDLGKLALPAVAQLMRKPEQVLCIVNTRARAAELYGMVEDEPGACHLSALMCPAHRSARLDEIRRKLKEGEPCRVVSTQLIEAGVDVSFPEVIREMAGLDSIVQAAGRCNREGEREGTAPVSVFFPDEGLGRAFGAQAEHTASVLRNLDAGADPFSPAAIRHYFRLHYWLQDSLDRKNVLADLNSLDLEWRFQEAQHKFRFIDNPMQPVIIPWNDRARKLIDNLRYVENPGGLLRELQQYTVQVYEGQLRALDHAGAVEWVADTYAVLCRMEHYDDRLGLTVPGEWRGEDFLI
ncbi:CRISPR-associated Cas3 family helicase [Pseudodesulfovibrio indicus]|uniref:CRISPR-associated Cas3 family helicase n=1 Tax=Pseudodesulfovibrio indicus TaxID=1716143 RepID=A0A126QS18_9BACT|nr:CRISPR-associated protein Cas3 [Pseudodesulfovibrio indicus]TDT90816.1 CRISPR-associated Cas3 family helicase [Pseudodesulfovibrio indicus]